ncbi:MAG: cytidylate kinase, partial [Stygiolobus sp.]|nr:cytidylate kinase [Stygiolobus sp.]
RYYGIDIFDLTNFDLVINTQYLKPNDVADLIITFIKKIQQTPPS